MYGLLLSTTERCMKHGFTQGLLLSLCALPLLMPAQSVADNLSNADMTNYMSAPILTVRSATPQVMLTMSRDHQYWFKAYNDYTDLTGTGVIDEEDTTYNHNFDYYGYFDSYKCYDYESNRFQPRAFTTNKYCDGVSGSWSGNFLNWATMARMDIVRKIFYGGKRAVDTDSLTVLERAYLPTDSHSFAKYYNGADIAQLTPFNNVNSAPPVANLNSSNNNFNSNQNTSIGANQGGGGLGEYRFRNTNLSVCLGDQIKVYPQGEDGTTNYMLGYVSLVRPAGAEVTRGSNGANNICNNPGTANNSGFRITVNNQGVFGSSGNTNAWVAENHSHAGLSICNTTVGSTTGQNSRSQTNTNPPLMRVAHGNYALWPTNERWQCHWQEESTSNNNAQQFENNFANNTGRTNGNQMSLSGLASSAAEPRRATRALGSGDGAGQFRVFVEVCSDADLIDSANRENCRAYPDGNHKPAGLLQRYGEDDLIHFGLLTGSFLKNISGGVVRKNIRSFQDEVNLNDGTFTDATGIRHTLDALRIYGYSYGPGDGGTYRQNQGDNCDFQLAGITEGTCTSWGNPISEIYLEALRYFAGLDPTPEFQYSGNDHLGLQDESWEDPLGSNNFCASLNTVVVNASVSSYDHHHTNRITDLGAPSIIELTDFVAAGEGILGNEWFVGSTGGDNDEFCTPKTINSLGDSLGICPEAPTVEGSYHLAGMAHYAQTNSIRDDLDGTQVVNTYAIQLSTNVPTIDVPLPDGSKVSILPAYRLIFNDGGGALVDFKVVEPHSCEGNICSARFYINWEDSEQGGDFDQDMWGMLDYELDTAAGTITVTTNAIAQSTANAQLFGFVISGTSQDGFHAYSGILGANRPGTGGVPGCTNCRAESEGGGQSGPQSHTFTVGGGSAGQLEDPLLYAAKWGNFDDINETGIPSADGEGWDSDGDGIPDSYFFVTDPGELEAALRRVFDAILERVSSGTAAAVVANEQSGVGAAYQALFDPVRTDQFDNEVKWLGTLQALFIDDQGLLREASGTSVSSQQLGHYNQNRVVQIFFDDADQRTKVRRWTSESNDEFIPISSTVVPLEELRPVWNARERLSDVGNVTSNRGTYGSSADNGRYILTWLGEDDEVDNPEVVPFQTSSFTNANYGWLDQTSLEATHNLVNWIRGEEIEGLRNRTLDYNGDGVTQVMRLADIVNSSPLPVGAPAEAFDLLAGDGSYAGFRSHYANRRQVVYVGSNGGMIHAFNAGFYDPSDRTFHGGGHPLGAELWAYVPKNLLGHLQWLADPSYEHVYYVDGEPRVFDARIFEPSDTHINGWGTVLVIGFRLGGGNDFNGIVLHPDGDTDSPGVKTKSAYVVMDITDPEQPPRVLAELAPEFLQFTTSRPTVALVGSPNADLDDDSSINDWYLVFGSGPNNLGTVSVTNDQRARLYAYDLKQLAQRNINKRVWDMGPESEGQFVGSPVVSDFNVNMRAEAMYFGTVGGVSADTGALWRLPIDQEPDKSEWGNPHRLLIADQPFVAQPSVALDQRRNPWVFASTGRLYANADKESTSQQTLYGVIDTNIDPFNLSAPSTTNSITIANLIDVTNAVVTPGGQVDLEGNENFDKDFFTLREEVRAAGGWRRDYNTNGLEPSQRGVVRSSVIGGIIFNTAFTPALDLCGAEGRSVLLGLAFDAGTPSPLGVFGTEACPTCPGEIKAVSEIDLGFGMASTPSIHIGRPGEGAVPGQVTVVVQQSTGKIVGTGAQTGGGMLSGEISWRELID